MAVLAAARDDQDDQRAKEQDHEDGGCVDAGDVDAMHRGAFALNSGCMEFFLPCDAGNSDAALLPMSSWASSYSGSTRASDYYCP